MKKKLLVLSMLVAFAIASTGGFAHGKHDNCFNGNGPDMGFGLRHLNMMQKELNLSDKQVKQIFDIGTQFRGKSFENRNNPDKLADLRLEHRKAVESILTKDQLDKLNASRNGCCGHGRWRD